MKNETTGKEAASIAGRVLRSEALGGASDTDQVAFVIGKGAKDAQTVVYLPLNAGQLKQALGSLLTQVADRKKPAKTFKGRVEDVVIHDRALSAEEVRARYAKTRKKGKR